MKIEIRGKEKVYVYSKTEIDIALVLLYLLGVAFGAIFF